MPASIRPAEVTVVPVTPMALVTAVEQCLFVVGFFADAAHHQDVVVFAQRHTEDEHQERQDEVQAALVAQVDEDDHGEAQCGQIRKADGGYQIPWRYQTAQQ